MIDMTQDMLNNNQPLSNLIRELDLKLFLDDFGMSIIIFCCDNELGYYFHSEEKGIELQYTKDYGLDRVTCTDWCDVSESIKSKIYS